MQSAKKIVRPDSKGRITLGHLSREVSSFEVEEMPDGTIRLVPRVEIPAQERWLFDNKRAKESVARGLKNAKDAATVDLGSFSKHANDDLDDDK
ncbi:MAG: hypothetical protein A2583_16640 [Bdellovibrionales bacterium RIFOXYD1_FULL_53_11]|nr:MAG: hypothetical protein A2583_16640 [Bdellovibrionales bacterium RIFOXYD1_FULL_53_11]